MRFSLLSSISSTASRSPWSWGISFLMSFSNSEYVIIWSRRSLIPYVIVIFTSCEAVALAPKPSVLAGGGAVIGGAPPGTGPVGAIPLSGCGDCFEPTRQRCLMGDLDFTGSFRFALAFQLTYSGCASGTKRLITTPIFSGSRLGCHS